MSDNLYDHMKQKGINMEWYERTKARTVRTIEAPLDENVCNRLSIYIVKADGSLWTVKSNGLPHSRVRTSNHTQKEDVFYCLYCKQQFPSYEAETDELREATPDDFAVGHWYDTAAL